MSGLREAVADALGADVTDARPIAGGSLNDAWWMEVAGRGPVFVKTADDAEEGVYATEAGGLAWLAEARSGLGVPGVVAVRDGDETPRLLVLEWVESSPGPLDEEALGRGLAALHGAGAPAHGGAGTLRIGPIALADPAAEDWPSCYAEARLRPVLRMAVDRGAIDRTGAEAVERVCARLDDLAGPAEPPARLHGDLWSGNVMTGAGGTPWIVDPAAYGGHREVDLAMLRLFGGPSERCFAAYEDAFPLAAGWEDRVALWQLFPLLVHAALFGGGYGARAAAVARRYA